MAKKISIANTRSIKKYFISLAIILGVVSLIIAGTLLALSIVDYVTNRQEVLLSLIILLPILIAILIVIVIIMVRRLFTIFYKNLYQNTENIIESLTNDKRNLNRYSADDIEEFDNLNKKLDDLADHNATLEITPRRFDYSKIRLEYLNKDAHLINESSFKKNIREIIYCSKFLRNGVLSITYEEGMVLDEKTIKDVVSKINNVFDEKDILISVKDNGSGFYVYIPAVESMTSLKSTLENILQKITLSKKTLNGIELFSPLLDVVVYPFSLINDIFSDLHYAERQEDRIFIYLPHRYIHTSNESLFEQSTNVNNTYKIIGSLSNIPIVGSDIHSFFEKVSEPLRQNALFYSFDQGGVIIYDKDKKTSIGEIGFSIDEKIRPLFPKDAIVSDKFITMICSNVDPDSSLFFSRRKLVSTNIGKQLDIYGISSGFFYKVNDVYGDYCALIYFININKKEIAINSYLQASLMFFSDILGGVIRNYIIQQEIVDVKEREQNLLKLTNIRSYSIDRMTHEVKSFSPSLKRDIPELEIGSICYKTMFGFDKPCATCPLLSKQKALKKIRGIDYEVASVLNNKSSNVTELTLSRVSGDLRTTNRFDPDYLINTNYSFIERLNDLYTAKARGYVALLKIKNLADLIDKVGSEGYAFLIRRFTKEINDQILKTNEIYRYKNDTIAIIFSSVGKLDAIDMIEKIYNISQTRFVPNDESQVLRISYDLSKYPQEHSNSEDFIRHMEYLCSQSEEAMATDSLYIEENDFTRPASKEEYILSIINQATAAKNFIIKCQPMVNGTDKSIFGSELLIRLSDEYRNSLLNTEEVISVAAKYGKLYNISDILIDFVGNLFKSSGISIFKPAGFTRMSINADFNYFKDSYSMTKILDAVSKYHLPKHFLTFEVTEAEIANHYDSFKDVVTTLRRNDIDIVCDRYYGDNLSFEKLKDIGITEIKSDRSLIGDIDINSEKFKSLAKLLQSADTLKMDITLVGVENGEQYNLIKGLNIKCNLQGYYFHHPLSLNELIEAIRTGNVM